MMLRVLPNRYISLLLTPREASLLEGQILDPGDYPWQDSEAMQIGLGVKAMLHEAVADMVARELDASIEAIVKIEQVRREALGTQEDSPSVKEEEGVETEATPTQEEKTDG